MKCKRIRKMEANNPEGKGFITYPVGSIVDGKDVGNDVVIMLCTHPKRYAIPFDDECRKAVSAMLASPQWKRRLEGLQQMEAADVFDSLSEGEQQRVLAFIEGGYIKSTHAATNPKKSAQKPPTDK